MHAHNFAQTRCNGSTCPSGDSECELHNKYAEPCVKAQLGNSNWKQPLENLYLLHGETCILSDFSLITERFCTLSNCYQINLSRAQCSDCLNRMCITLTWKQANSWQPGDTTGREALNTWVQDTGAIDVLDSGHTPCLTHRFLLLRLQSRANTNCSTDLPAPLSWSIRDLMWKHL